MYFNFKNVVSLIALKTSLLTTVAYSTHQEDEDLKRVLEQSRLTAAEEEATRSFLEEEQVKHALEQSEIEAATQRSLNQSQYTFKDTAKTFSDEKVDYSDYFNSLSSNSKSSDIFSTEKVDYSDYFNNLGTNSKSSSNFSNEKVDYSIYFNNLSSNSKASNNSSKNKLDFSSEKQNLVALRLRQEQSGLSAEDFFEVEQKRQLMEAGEFKTDKEFSDQLKAEKALYASFKPSQSSSEASKFTVNLLNLEDVKPEGPTPNPRSIIERQKKYILKIQNIIEDNNNFKNPQLELKQTSGKDNNCLLYSFIGNNENLLAEIMEDKEFAKNILFVPELSSGEGISGRDFKPVRAKIFQDITQNLDQKFETSPLNEFTDNSKITLREVIENIRKNELDRGYQFLTTEQYLKKIVEDSPLLDIGFADVLSVLYKRPTFVFNPITETIGVEKAKTKDGQNIMRDINRPTHKINVVNGRYLNITNLEGNPIFIHHKGFGGVHYSRLVRIN